MDIEQYRITEDQKDAAYDGDLGERCQALFNQHVWVELCSIDSEAQGHHFVMEVKTLNSREFEPTEAQCAPGSSVFYSIPKEIDPRAAFVAAIPLIDNDAP